MGGDDLAQCDVSIGRRWVLRYLLAVILFLVSIEPLRAQDTTFEPIFLPVYTEQALVGAGGAEFRTQLGVFSTNSFRYFPGPSGEITTQQALIPSLSLSTPSTGRGGRVIYVERSESSNVHFGYHLESTHPTGIMKEQRTLLPVVRERDFRRGRIELLNVPNRPILEYPTGVAGVLVGQQMRHMLRIYELDGRGDLSVDVVIHLQGLPGDDGQPLRVNVDRRDGNDASYPYYVEVPLTLPCYPMSLHTPCRTYDARITLLPANDDRYWAFISSTDNTTDVVSITGPQ